MPGLLYLRDMPINDRISIHIPTIGEVLDNEDNYYDLVCSIIATPYDMMVQLDDAGIDFTKINDFELFCLMFPKLQSQDTSLVFGELDLTKFRTAVNENTKDIMLIDSDSETIIDRLLYLQICDAVCKVLHTKRNDKRPANEEAKNYELKKARKKLERMKKKQKKIKTSQLEDSIISLVNTAEFPYDYNSVRDITIFQFYSSLNQIAHKIRFDNTMIGYYAGTVKMEDISHSERTWFKTESDK